MAIKSNLDKHLVNWLVRLDEEGKLNKNISIQRKEVWDLEKKSNLIVSILLNIPIESLLFEELEDGGESFNVLDGKQRTLTLCQFVKGDFLLSPKTKHNELAGTTLTGMGFLDLPGSMRNKILEYELSISKLRPLNDEERATVFFMRNQAVGLTKMDLSRVVMGQKATDLFSGLCEHDFFINKVKFTRAALKRHDDLSVLLQYMILTHRPDAGLSGAEIMSLCDDIKSKEIKISKRDTEAVLSYLDKAISERKPYLKKVHLPIIMHTALQAREKKVNAKDFGECLDNFFDKLEADGEYMMACKSGSAKRTNVQTRVRIMGNMLNTDTLVKEDDDSEM